MRIATSIVSTVALIVAAVGSPPGTGAGRSREKASATLIVVHAASRRGHASSRLLGVNHHYNANGYGLWNARDDAPVRAVVAGSRRAGIQSVRFPGGTIANLFDWKNAIGPHHGCQVDGRGSTATGFPAVSHRLAFGPDEYMRYLRTIHAAPLIMMPFVTETPADAADWVEYMDSPANAPGNPHGGVDWADVRARNGHPQPYDVRRWEVGNEQNHPLSRYWLSPRTSTAVRQYAFGGSRVVSGEALGKNCAHPRHGIPSDGTAHQVFRVIYPPVRPSSVRVAVAGTQWRRVSRLGSSGPQDRVFTVGASNGEVRFGDGAHGAVPPSAATVVARYTSVHAGFFRFAARMKAVDPRIRVCSSWGTPQFVALARGRRYDCLTAHPITSFAPLLSSPHWSGPLAGHDAFMRAADRRRAQVARLLDVMPPRTPLWLTEASSIHGDTAAFPLYSTSASHAAYMATLWADWMNLGISWGMGDDLLWRSDRAVLGPAPDYTFTADAVTRQTLRPMFNAGGHVLATTVTRNPVRRSPTRHGAYTALKVSATRHRNKLFVLVVNRLPRRSITARLRLDGARSKGSAVLRTARGSSFTSVNDPGRPPSFRLVTHSRSIGPGGLVQAFPATSTTVLEIPTT